MVEVPYARTLASLGRWSLIGAVILMGASLVATVWSTSRSVEEASETLVRGQASGLFAGLRGIIRADDPQAALDELVAQQQASGLVYVVMFERDGAVRAESGTPSRPRAELLAFMDTAEVGEPVPIGDRVRVWYGAPRRLDGDGRSRRPRSSTIVELVPHMAHALRADARRSLGLGVVAGALLLAAAIVLVRWFMRHEARSRALEHARRLASLGEMSAVLAHEIRNPIASLKGNAQLLVKMLPDAGKPRSKAERLVEESVRLEKLTGDLLEFARAGAIERAPADPTAILRAAIASTPSAAAREIVIEAQRAPARWAVDAARLQQVLANVLDNACEASDRVETRIAVEKDELVFRVRDHGDGLIDEPQRLFEPFFTRKTRGTGLGLSVARRLVELHGGTIEARNHPDGGAEFRIAIPSP